VSKRLSVSLVQWRVPSGLIGLSRSIRNAAGCTAQKRIWHPEGIPSSIQSRQPRKAAKCSSTSGTTTVNACVSVGIERGGVSESSDVQNITGMPRPARCQALFGPPNQECRSFASSGPVLYAGCQTTKIRKGTHSRSKSGILLVIGEGIVGPTLVGIWPCQGQVGERQVYLSHIEHGNFGIVCNSTLLEQLPPARGSVCAIFPRPKRAYVAVASLSISTIGGRFGCNQKSLKGSPSIL
jgi:hypothetical protein